MGGARFEPLGELAVTEREEGRLRLRGGAATVELAAIAPDILRVGLFPDGRPPEYRSEAVILEPAGGDVDPARLDPFRFEASSDGALRVSAPKLPGERFFACG